MALTPLGDTGRKEEREIEDEQVKSESLSDEYPFWPTVLAQQI